MKTFKCGKCQALHKFDETKVTASKFVITCTQCGARNVVVSGPMLVAQSSKNRIEFPLVPGENTIGRAVEQPKATILIDDQYVSRNHATIRLETRDGKVYFSIEDTKSMNGVFDKNKKRIKPNLKYPFMPDDYFIIGLTKLSIKP